MSATGPIAHRRRAFGRPRAGRVRFLLIAAVGALLLGGGLSASGAEPPTIPPRTTGTDQAALLRGLVDVGKVKTVVSLPLQVQRAYANEQAVYGPPGCVRGGTPRCTTLTLYNRVWAVSPTGTDPGFGAFPPVVSYVMGFGALPVKATILLTQPVDENGFYEALDVVGSSNIAGGPLVTVSDVDGRVLLQVVDVSVDGVALDVGPDCRGSEPIDLHLDGQPGYNLPTGGKLSGTFTIPPFDGCAAGGQDLDPLLTGTISGPDNVLELVQQPLGNWTTAEGFPNNCARGFGTNASPCSPPPTLPVPTAALPRPTEAATPTATPTPTSTR